MAGAIAGRIYGPDCVGVGVGRGHAAVGVDHCIRSERRELSSGGTVNRAPDLEPGLVVGVVPPVQADRGGRQDRPGQNRRSGWR